MAIAAPHYHYFKFLRQKNLLPAAKSILEIGEQNWYGDLDPKILADDALVYSKQESAANYEECLIETINNPSSTHAFDLAKHFYRIYFNSESIKAIDLHGTKDSMPLDLNVPHELGEQFDAIFNLGTAEHIFNVYQAFKSMHDWLKVGGQIYHSLPMHGEIDHGFYNFHPTFYWDLAYANNYKIIAIAKCTMKSIYFADSRIDLSQDILKQDVSNTYGLMVAFEKTIDKPFEIPQQGRYDSNNPDQKTLEIAWVKQRQDADSRD